MTAAPGLLSLLPPTLAEELAGQLDATLHTEARFPEVENGELAAAAAAYAEIAAGADPDSWRDGAFKPMSDGRVYQVGMRWDSPWPSSWHWTRWRPRSPREDMLHAAGLLLAELVRLHALDNAPVAFDPDTGAPEPQP